MWFGWLTRPLSYPQVQKWPYDTDLTDQPIPFPHGHSDWVKDGLETQVDQWNFSWTLVECWETEADVAKMQDVSLEVPGATMGTGHAWEGKTEQTDGVRETESWKLASLTLDLPLDF